MWKVCAVAMTLDQTHSLFLKKDWKTHFQTFQKQFMEEKQIKKPKPMKSGCQIIFKTDMFQAVTGNQLRNTNVHKIKYVLSYIHCNAWRIAICCHLQELSPNSKEQMEVARHFRSLGHLRSLWKNALHLTDSQQDYFVPSVHIKHFFM